ncbi:MAG: type II toxin-antitoxin system HipA family toxin, partial [Bacteroidota bacterium]
MKEIIIYADWIGLPTALEMGILRAERSRREEVFSFEYTQAWLQSGYAQEIDPDLKLFAGPQYITDEKPNFGLFLDSSPDRWGKTLMDRRESILARQENRDRRRLTASDYLLGVNDETRMGGLRFKLDRDDHFLSQEKNIKTPPLTSIRELEQASLNIENDDLYDDKDAQKWLFMLVAPGSSLGGARPKANVKDPAGNLWIAKFPSKNDERNIGAWEWMANQMAQEL